ncbi:MAG: hypothetical protein R3296_02250 [Oleiphilaceae bacterium]|nr:hypothetical protein [Oleiphilaceae bacterium]
MSHPGKSRRKATAVWMILVAALAAGALALLAGGHPVMALVLLALALYCLGQWQRSRLFRLDPGPLTLSLAPDPGALQGDVAGRVQSDNPQITGGRLFFLLRCVQVQERYRGHVIEHRKVVRWQARQPAYPITRDNGVDLHFQFSPPPGLAGSEAKPGLEEDRWQHYHYWELVLTGDLDGRPLAVQRFRPSVQPGDATAETPLPESYRSDRAREADPENGLPEALKARLALEETDEGLQFRDAASPPRLVALACAALALLTGWLGGLWLALLPGLAALWLMGRLGRIWLRPGQATLIRHWFGRPLYARHGPLTESRQLELTPLLVPPLLTGGEPRYRLSLKGEGKQIVLARDLRSQEEAEALRRFIARQMHLSG